MSVRFWMYDDWDGKRLLRSSDEYGRRTLVVRLWGTRAVVWAYRSGFMDQSA